MSIMFLQINLHIKGAQVKTTTENHEHSNLSDTTGKVTCTVHLTVLVESFSSHCLEHELSLHIMHKTNAVAQVLSGDSQTCFCHSCSRQRNAKTHSF